MMMILMMILLLQMMPMIARSQDVPRTGEYEKPKNKQKNNEHPEMNLIKQREKERAGRPCMRANEEEQRKTN